MGRCSDQRDIFDLRGLLGLFCSFFECITGFFLQMRPFLLYSESLVAQVIIKVNQNPLE